MAGGRRDGDGCGADGTVIWVTGTSGTCVSIFKPVFLGGRPS